MLASRFQQTLDFFVQRPHFLRRLASGSVLHDAFAFGDGFFVVHPLLQTASEKLHFVFRRHALQRFDRLFGHGGVLDYLVEQAVS